jgi:hypothetical protein
MSTSMGSGTTRNWTDVPDNWWDDPEVVLSIAGHAVDDYELTTPQAVVAFFEKPYNYSDLYMAWAREYA